MSYIFKAIRRSTFGKLVLLKTLIPQIRSSFEEFCSLCSALAWKSNCALFYRLTSPTRFSRMFWIQHPSLLFCFRNKNYTEFRNVIIWSLTIRATLLSHLLENLYFACCNAPRYILYRVYESTGYFARSYFKELGRPRRSYFSANEREKIYGREELIANGEVLSRRVFTTPDNCFTTL